MLQDIRKSAKGFIAKFIIFLLVGSFGLWGISDYLTGQSGSNVVAKVGDVEITLQQLSEAYRNDINQGQLNSLDAETQRNLNLAKISLERLIDNALLRSEIKAQGLEVGDEAMRELILINPEFMDANGNFSLTVFKNKLALSRLTEAGFLEAMKTQMLTNLMVGAFAPISPAPPALSNLLFDQVASRRDAVKVTLTQTAIDAPASPSADSLAKYFKENEEEFRVPELRNLSFIWLSTETLLPKVKIEEAALLERYESLKASLTVLEERDIQQIRLSKDDTKNQEILNRIANGDNPQKLVTDGVLEASALNDLGMLKRNDFPDATLADAAFSLSSIGATAPIDGLFGKVILYVKEIKAAKTPSFDEVKMGIQNMMASEEISKLLPEEVKSLDDLLGRGSSLEQAAAELGVSVINVAITANGQTLDGSDPVLPEGDFLKQAFELTSNETGFVSQNDQGEAYVIQVNAIEPSHIPEQSEIEAKLIAAYTGQEIMKNLENRAKDLVARVNPQTSLEQIASAENLSVQKLEQFDRAGQSVPQNGGTNEILPASQAEELFKLTLNQAISSPIDPTTNDDKYAFNIFEVTKISPADTSKLPELMDRVRQSLAASFQKNRYQHYIEGLKAEYKVTIYDDVLNMVY